MSLCGQTSTPGSPLCPANHMLPHPSLWGQAGVSDGLAAARAGRVGEARGRPLRQVPAHHIIQPTPLSPPPPPGRDHDLEPFPHPLTHPTVAPSWSCRALLGEDIRRALAEGAGGSGGAWVECRTKLMHLHGTATSASGRSRNASPTDFVPETGTGTVYLSIMLDRSDLSRHALRDGYVLLNTETKEPPRDPIAQSSLSPPSSPLLPRSLRLPPSLGRAPRPSPYPASHRPSSSPYPPGARPLRPHPLHRRHWWADDGPWGWAQPAVPQPPRRPRHPRPARQHGPAQR